jgi:alpha-beta hydrolase superfamily lysophospholipase
MQHSEGKFTASDGLEIYHQVWAADGTPKAAILIVHGLGEHSSRYHNYTDYFVPRGYTLYGFDLRGHGRSGGPRGHVERFDRFVDDVGRMVALIREQLPHTPLFLLGHSLGSLPTLVYALRYPDGLAGVITSGTALRDALEIPGWKRALARMLSRVAPTVKFDNGIQNDYLTHDTKAIEAYAHDPLVHRIATPRLATEVEAARQMLYASASEWKLPLLMLHGSDDRICLPAGAQAFQAKTPQTLTAFRQYDGLYHEIHNEMGKESVFYDIENWLADKVAGAISKSQPDIDRNKGG